MLIIYIYILITDVLDGNGGNWKTLGGWVNLGSFDPFEIFILKKKLKDKNRFLN